MRPGLRGAASITNTPATGWPNLFMMFAPLEGWRHVKVTDRRTAVDYAHVLKDLADVHFAQAETILLIQDNLNTHAAASLYEAFPAAEAGAAVERFEWHYTPKHGSWLDLAESERRRPRLAMPRPAHPQQTGHHRRGRRLGLRAEQNSRRRRVAIHNEGCQDQAEKLVPFAMIELPH